MSDRLTPPQLLRLATALVTGLMAGFFFAFAADVAPAFETLPGPIYAGAMQAVNVAVRNAAFGSAFGLAVILPVATLAASWRDGAPLPFALTAAGLAVYLPGVVWVTAQINLPLNAYIATWDVQAPPPDWAAVRGSWAGANLARTAAAMVAFICHLAALGLAPDGHDRGRS